MNEPSSRFEIPKKPYLIKSLLEDGFGGNDGIVETSNLPHYLVEDTSSLSTASQIIQGSASKHLPIIYVSAFNDKVWALSKTQIEKLAFDLGGVAHIFVEPSRKFSFELRDLASGRNAYGGTVGIYLPGIGHTKSLYLGGIFGNASELATAVRSAALQIRSQTKPKAWDWSELQEQALRAYRNQEKAKLNNDEITTLYEEEISSLREQITDLKSRIASLQDTVLLNNDENEILNVAFTNRLGPEIYPSEFTDKIRYAAIVLGKNGENLGIDKRTLAILDRISKTLPISKNLDSFIKDIEDATRDPKRISKNVPKLLMNHGYKEASDKTHINLSNAEGFVGLENITVAKTPSDVRGPKNLKSEILNKLGLKKKA